MVSWGRSPVPLDKCPEWDDAGPLSIFVKTDGGISTCRWLCQFKFFIELGSAGFMDDRGAYVPSFAFPDLLSPFSGKCGMGNGAYVRCFVSISLLFMSSYCLSIS